MNQFQEKIEEARTDTGVEIGIEKPTETHTWRYNLRDLTDETIIGIIVLAVVAGLCIYSNKSTGGWIWLMGILPAAYWLWLAYLVFIRRLCTIYKLTPQNFIVQRGFLVQNTMYIELFNIEQVNLKRNLWERIIGIGTIRLRVKKIPQNEGSDVTNPKLKIDRDGYLEINIPGMANFEHVRELIDNYRLYVRQKRGVMISS